MAYLRKINETPEQNALKHIQGWRKADKDMIADKNGDTKYAEYQARQKLRSAADALEVKS